MNMTKENYSEFDFGEEKLKKFKSLIDNYIKLV